MKFLATARPGRNVPQRVSARVVKRGHAAVARRDDASERASKREPGHELDLVGRFQAIYDDWFVEVSRWIRALGGQDADRDDIVQEVFLVVRRRLSAFDGVNLPAWLYRITRRQVRDFRRRTWVKHIFTKLRFDEPDALPNAGGSPAMALEQKENQRLLYTLLSKMQGDRRSAFVLFEIEGLSGEEISRVQNVPLNTVWTRLHHARKEFFALAGKLQRAQARERDAQRDGTMR